MSSLVPLVFDQVVDAYDKKRGIDKGPNRKEISRGSSVEMVLI
jgi:hypothetical protein